MKRVLIIGGSGFIGRHIASACVSSGYTVTIADPVRPAFIDNVSWIPLNVCDPSAFETSLVDQDAVIYLASTTLPGSSNECPDFDVATNLAPMIRLLEALRNMSGVQLIYASSGGTVYGHPQDLPISENHPTSPLCSYGIVKLSVEKYIEMYKQLYGVNGIVLRIANPYGLGEFANRPQGALGVFVNRVALGLPIEVWGDGMVVRDYVHVSDVARAFLASLEYAGNESIFNIGSGVGVNIADLVRTIFRVTDRCVDVFFREPRGFDVTTNILNIGRALNELHWAPHIALDEGIFQLFMDLKSLHLN